MRAFLIQKKMGLASSSGEYRANISLLKYLSSQGHATAQFCFAKDGEVASLVAEAEAAGKKACLSRSEFQLPLNNDNTIPVGVSTFTSIDGIHMIALDATDFRKGLSAEDQGKETMEFMENSKLTARLHAFILQLNTHMTLFQPTHIIFNDALSLKATSDLPLLTQALRIFVIHCAEELPFGPFAGGLPESACSREEHDLLLKVDGVWAVSEAIQDYAKKYGQLDSTFLVHHPWTYLDEKTVQLPPQYHNVDKDLVGMVNPCHVKGVHILQSVAKRLPNIKFAAWQSWGFDEDIRKELEEIPNIEVRDTCKNMEDAWKEIKVLIVPSLWFEAWGIVVIEAQIRGIPVLSSNAGALKEAKLGIPHTIPVTPLTGERSEENGVYIIPDQNSEPWATILERLMNNKEEYEALANRSRKETVDWILGLNSSALEQWMEGLEKKK